MRGSIHQLSKTDVEIYSQTLDRALGVLQKIWGKVLSDPKGLRTPDEDQQSQRTWTFNHSQRLNHQVKSYHEPGSDSAGL